MGSSSPIINFRRVVLPIPLGPTIAKRLPEYVYSEAQLAASGTKTTHAADWDFRRGHEPKSRGNSVVDVL